MLLTPMFKGADMPADVGLYLRAGSISARCRSDSFGYHWKLNPGSVGASPSR